MRSTKRVRTRRLTREIAREAHGKFAKGVSANPGGRPKGKSEFAALAREHSPECLERLLYWVRSEHESASVNACRLIIERGYGRVETADHVVLNGEDDRPSVTVRFIPPPDYDELNGSEN